MKNDMVQPADRQKFAALIYDEAQAMRSLINDVLTLSNLDESAFGDDAVLIDLHDVAERVAGRLGSFAADQSVAGARGGLPRRVSPAARRWPRRCCTTS